LRNMEIKNIYLITLNNLINLHSESGSTGQVTQLKQKLLEVSQSMRKNQ